MCQYVECQLLNVGAWICHIAREGQRIHVNTTKLRNLMCTLVAIGVILRSLECNWFQVS